MSAQNRFSRCCRPIGYGHARSPRPPHVYMAGKITQNGWRHDLVPGLRGHLHEEGPLNCGWFIYNGPFFVSCDHDCRHRPGNHGAAGTGCDTAYISPEAVFRCNQTALLSADMVFAYINATDCHGTILEIGFALHARIPVFLHFAPGIDPTEFWYMNVAATGGQHYSIIPRDYLPEILHADIMMWKRP